ncbi:hypothetical protein QQM39_10745 [Streptomyces sp. DT2A-34]|uniref:hypothetical protein n=1 Tax=Streptomyces sp. DT2A-34 TaxID=3051182 RepID=UPI00265BDB6F|nr:hypothetical protein [Streptomyces sp. DT2A-34]MDO0911311.1 hypothetical protein [Streptomyces sp. DT2A-34]
MIHISESPDSHTAQLLDARSQVRADTDAMTADPLVLDCARRLLADPGGETARVWVAGLAEMVPYLAGQPSPEAERTAVEGRSGG